MGCQTRAALQSWTLDNRDHYYLRDAMGGHMGVIVDDERADPCG